MMCARGTRILRVMLSALGIAVLAPSLAAQSTIAPAALFPYQPGVDVTHYDWSIVLPSKGNAIQGVALISLQRAKALESLRLDLVGLTVDAVEVNGRACDARVDSTGFTVPLRAEDGSRLRIGVRYHGSPRDGLIVREDTARGWSAFGDNWPNRARFWLPTVDHPSDKATVSWHVTAPAALAVIANGNRTTQVALSPAAVRARSLDSTVVGGWRTTSFALTQPIPTYLMVIGVAAMKETRLGNTACGSRYGGACVPQSVMTFAPETPTMPGNFREAGRIVQTFAQMVGPYAYDRLTHVQSATRFGGMENATAIFYSDNAFRQNRVGTGLIAHETAHQWFGDAVTPRRWQDLWLSEGFATYFAALYTQRSRGDSAFRAEMQRIRDEIIAADVVAKRPVVDTVGAETPLTLLNANSYQKGGFVLHMLRTQLGDSAFFGALRAYQRRYRHGTAITDELRAELERRSGTSLATFFNEWLHAPGYANVSLTWTYSADKRELTVIAAQLPPFAPRHFPLTLRVKDVAGASREITLLVDAKTSTARGIPLPGMREVAEVIADPRVALLAKIEVLHAMP